MGRNYYNRMYVIYVCMHACIRTYERMYVWMNWAVTVVVIVIVTIIIMKVITIVIVVIVVISKLPYTLGEF